MRTSRHPGLLLFLFIVVVLVGATFTVRALTRPAEGAQAKYTALFTNASGLRPGDDVRLLGVQVGKVKNVSIRRDDGGRGAVAEVGFTLATGTALTSASTLGIRFQNLTGLRYLDVRPGEGTGASIAPGATIGTGQTVPSFDITTIFNGLQPVLVAMKPQDINHLMDSLAAVVAGDGSGLRPLLDALETLTRFSDDRSALLRHLVANMSALNDTLGGRHTAIPTVISYLQGVAGVLRDAAPSTRILSDQGAALMTAADDLLRGLGLGTSNSTWLALAGPELPRVQALVDLWALTPGLFAALTRAPVPKPGGATGCSRGEAMLPGGAQVFLRGMKVTLCAS